MTSIRLAGFRGEVPRVDRRLLPEQFAQVAENVGLVSGRLDPINSPALVSSLALAADIETLYRYEFSGIYYWLAWSQQVSVARSPYAQDTLGRLYFCDEDGPRMTTFADAISGGGPYPAASFVLGIAPPRTAMTVTPSGGTGTQETRAYLYTFVSRYAEESGPSPVTLATGYINGTWALSALDSAPPNTGTISAALANTPVAGTVRVAMDTTFGVLPGEKLVFAGVAGMTDLNGEQLVDSIDELNNFVFIKLTTAQLYTSGGTWTRKALHNLSNMTKRIYRTVGTGSDFKLVKEIPAATTTTNDTVASTDLGLLIEALETDPPPRNMRHITALPNGGMAGLANNELCLSEIGKPWSWPIENRYPFPAKGKGLVAVGNNVIIPTDEMPQMASATVPNAAALQKIRKLAPCVSEPGVVDAGVGAVYPSHDGLYLATGVEAINLTEEIFTRKQWQAMNPSTFRAAFSDNTYYAAFDLPGGTQIFALELSKPDSAVRFGWAAKALYGSNEDGLLYVTAGTSIYQWDSDENNRLRMFWKSKEYELPKPTNYSAAQVLADFSEIVPPDTSILDANIALMADADKVGGGIGMDDVGALGLGESRLKPYSSQTMREVTFSIWVDNQLRWSKALVNDRPFRLPAGYKTDKFAISISANVPVRSLAVAESVEELGRV